MKLIVVAVATAAIIANSAHAQNSRVLEPEAGNQQRDHRKLSIQRTPPGKLRSPCQARGRRMEQRTAPPAIRTLIACRRELRGAREQASGRITRPEGAGPVGPKRRRPQP
jgi:hypothetical protein